MTDQAAGKGRTTRRSGPRGGDYEAVVYVHGMGSQRRYEETSRLVDRLDRYVNGARSVRGLGALTSIRAQVEPLRDSQVNDIVGYIETRYSSGTNQPARKTRFYEAYWAPVMAGTSSPGEVLKWLFAQPGRPFKTLRSPWRERQRLRRASLVALFERDRSRPAGIRREDYSAVLEAYDDFEGLDAQRDYPAGSFEDFLIFLAARVKADPRVIGLATRWRRAYVAEEWRNGFLLTSMALALLLLGGGAVLGILSVLGAVLSLGPISDLVESHNWPFKADWKTAVTIAVSLAGFLGLNGFLTNYLGDVQAWATYEETDAKHMARNKTLEQCMRVMAHVLRDDACKRVTVVAHSLGTSVAHDALLSLSRRNRANGPAGLADRMIPLEKIEHFVTMGSPIDKIEYFFESFASQSHRYKRVVEDLRGDIGSDPFVHGGKPHIHWINYWDEGDIISGALHSPASAHAGRQHVDNVQIASFHFPAPGASHSGYFDHEGVIGDLFRIIFQRAGAFSDLPPKSQSPADYEELYMGPGEAPASRLYFLVLAVALPWLALAGAVTALVGQKDIALGLWLATGLVFAGLLLAYWVGKARGQRRPF